MAARGGYRGGSYRRRPVGSRIVLYATLVAVALWLVAPFAWLFVTSISYQKNLLARPFRLVPPDERCDLGAQPAVQRLLLAGQVREHPCYLSRTVDAGVGGLRVSQRVSHHCLSLLRGRRYLGTPELPESEPFGFLLLLDPAAERDGKGIQPGDPCGRQDHDTRRREHSERDPYNQSEHE